MTKEKSAPENSQNLLSSESNHEASVQGLKRKNWWMSNSQELEW